MIISAPTSSCWTTVPLGRLFRRVRRTPRPSDGVVTAFRDGQVALRSRRRTDGFTEAIQEIGYQGIRKGDLVIHAMDAFAGAIGVSEDDGKSSPVYTVLTPSAIVQPRFYAYVLRNLAKGGGIQALAQGIRERSTDFRWAVAKTVPVPFPGLEEQTAIADYLDRETAEIDAFIEDHERLLQLLDERVTTTIEATILGVDAATTVDTGQEWPATLPFGWTAQRVSWLFDATGSGTTPTSDDVDAFDGDIPWVTTGELREKAISTSEKKVSSETLRRYSALKVHPTGSLLIAMYGATIGRVGWLEVPATVNQAVCVLSGYKAGPLRFPYYALLAARPYLLTLASGGGQPNINQDKIRSLRLPVPPPAEQERIVAELDHTLEAEYAMRRDVERSLELARERKTALISAAVTGQIDVAAQDVPAAEQLRDELEAHL